MPPLRLALMGLLHSRSHFPINFSSFNPPLALVAHTLIHMGTISRDRAVPEKRQRLLTHAIYDEPSGGL